MSRRQRGTGAPISLFSFQDLITSLSGILILLVLLMAVEIAVKGVTSKPDAQDDLERTQRLVGLRARAEALRNRFRDLQAAQQNGGANDPLATAQESIRAELKFETLQNGINRLRDAIIAMEKPLERARQEEKEVREKSESLSAELEKLRSAQTLALTQRKMFVIPEEGAPKTAVIVECSGNSVRAGYIDRPVAPVTFSADESLNKVFGAYIEKLSSSSEYIVFMIKPSGVKVFKSLILTARSRDFDVGYDALEEDQYIEMGSEKL